MNWINLIAAQLRVDIEPNPKGKLEGKRKLIATVFFTFVAIAMGAMGILDSNDVKELVLVTIGLFFTGNGIEHLTNTLNTKTTAAIIEKVANAKPDELGVINTDKK